MINALFALNKNASEIKIVTRFDCITDFLFICSLPFAVTESVDRQMENWFAINRAIKIVI